MCYGWQRCIPNHVWSGQTKHRNGHWNIQPIQWKRRLVQLGGLQSQDANEGQSSGEVTKWLHKGSVHTKILEMQVESRECEEFERRLQEEYGFNDSRKLTKKGLMDWCTTKVPQEFEKRCVLLSTLDRMALYMSKVQLFLRV